MFVFYTDHQKIIKKILLFWKQEKIMHINK